MPTRYRIELQWWMFAAAGAAAIAFLTVGFQAVKAAVANPVQSLRSSEVPDSPFLINQSQNPGAISAGDTRTGPRQGPLGKRCSH